MNLSRKTSNAKELKQKGSKYPETFNQKMNQKFLNFQ